MEKETKAERQYITHTQSTEILNYMTDQSTVWDSLILIMLMRLSSFTLPISCNAYLCDIDYPLRG